MKESDRKKFQFLMGRAKVTLPSQTSLTTEEMTLRIDVFWEALKEFNIKIVASAFEEAFKLLKWFPSPVEIRNFIGQLDEKEMSGPLLEWNQPTEEGCAMAHKILGEIIQRIQDQEDAEEEKRVIRFEENRARLKKQAKIFNK